MLADFGWQDGYGAFSVSSQHLDALIYYIANQEEHHKKEDFQTEFRKFLHKYGVEYDEKYVLMVGLSNGLTGLEVIGLPRTQACSGIRRPYQGLTPALSWCGISRFFAPSCLCG